MKGLDSFAAIDPAKPSPSREPWRPVSAQEVILAQFDDAQRREILYKQKLLSSLGYFIGKDFDMPILLNEPGAGWHWNFKENFIKIDPKDLLEKPLDYLRFVISHEGGHRRISRTGFIPDETWQQPGFSFMMNAIEDPRDNNFVAEAYPKFREQMELAYTLWQESEAEAKAAAMGKLGTKPRFLQAGHEYNRQWFREVQGQPFEIDPELPEDVRDVVEKTLPAAQESWWRYPSKAEADESEALVSRYAEASYRINLEKVWPEYQKLVDEDIKDQQTKKALDGMGKGKGEKGEEGEPQVGSPDQPGDGIPQNLKDKLTPAEQAELEKALGSAAPQAPGEGGEGGTPQQIDVGELSPELKKKIEEYIDSLPEEQKRALAEMARQAIRELEEEINAAIEAKLAEHGERPHARPEGEPRESDYRAPAHLPSPEDAEAIREKLRELLEADTSAYAATRQEVLPIIDRLEEDLREIFVERRARKWEHGHRVGKRINLKRRIQEKVKGVAAGDSRAWEKREAPQERDYAVSLLVDLSGSMKDGGKIRETFKATVVLCEVLNRLGVNVEITGFNDRLHEFQAFDMALGDEARDGMGAMLSEVHSDRARYNDDGWALGETSARLARQKAAEKFLIVLSDGIPEPSAAHGGSKFSLPGVVKRVTEEADQKLIGLGVGPGTGHVARYYPSSLADVPVAEMAEKLADLVREAIANYQDF